MEMLTRQILASAAPTVVRSVRRWIFHLGGLGFIPLGLLDSSMIPLPGSVDVLTIVLSAGNQGLWLYYALMATVGSVIGGFVTYRLARKGGKETLERKFPARRLEKVYKIFRRWGFGAIAIAALLPPPAPTVPFLCGGRNAIFRQKISLRTNARPDYPILPPGVPGGPLWTANAHGHLATWTSGPHGGYRADYGGIGGTHFHSRK